LQEAAAGAGEDCGGEVGEELGGSDVLGEGVGPWDRSKRGRGTKDLARGASDLSGEVVFLRRDAFLLRRGGLLLKRGAFLLRR